MTNDAETEPTGLAHPVESDATGDIAESIVATLSSGDWRAGLDQLNQHWMEAWFYIPPESLRSLLSGVPASAIAEYPGTHYLASLVTGSPRPATPAETAALTPRTLAMLDAMQVAELRFSGRMREALDGTRSLMEHRHPAGTALVDSSAGLEPLVFLQAGATALLAGDLDAAAAWLTRGRDDTASAMRFVFRDAAAKLAVLHALAGSVSEARGYLQEALTAARSRAWTEHWIDSTAQMARVLIETDDREQAADLARTPWRVLGEMWPFALAAQVRVLLTAGDLDAAQHALTTIEAMELPGAGGDGMVGAVIPLGLATVALARGNATEARAHLDRAPDDLVFTRALAARSELMAGRPAEAVRLGTLALVEFSGFAQVAFELAGIIATAELQLGDTEAAQRTAFEVTRRWHEVPVGAHARIPVELMTYAREHWHDDPDLALLGLSETPALFPAMEEHVDLSDRELEILRLLATSATRRELCDRLFISANTLASHIKNVYRKLGVSSREQAVQQAGIRGLLQ